MYKRFFVVCLAVLLFAGIAVAQRTTGVIAGQVTDPQGLAVPGAKVTVSDEATGFKRDITAGEDGSFSVPNLSPASYKVTVTVTNFKTFQTTVTVFVDRTTTVTAKLEIGEATAVVQVESSLITVDTTKATVQGTVTGKQIDSLPLNGRNFLDLAQLDPGVQTVDGGFFVPFEATQRLVGEVTTGDDLEIDVPKGTLTNRTSGKIYSLRPLGDVLEIVKAGGVFAYARQAGFLKS